MALKAEAPVPVAWLLEVAEEQEGESLWKKILRRCQARLEKDKNALWAGNAIKVINEKSETLAQIEKGLKRALGLGVVALQVPDDAVTESSKQDISSVEHLFQRLNRGGTVLDGPELVYTMIKAYMQGVESTLEEMEIKPMAYSSLALLGTRAAQAQNQSKKLPPTLSVTLLRALARDKSKEAEFNIIKHYFGLLEGTSDPDGPYLERVIRQVDDWLLWDRDTNQAGLPPVLRTNIAQNTPDVYLLLMILARRALDDKQSNEQLVALCRPILGLATALCWFGDDRPGAVEKLFIHFASRPLVPDSFSGVLGLVQNLDRGRRGVLQLQRPEMLRQTITMPDERNLPAWSWWRSLIEKPANGDELVQRRRQESIWPFIERLKGSRDLLIYAQREWMAIRFRGFDPAKPEALEDCNRPWDYDHILPQNSFSNLKPAPKLMDVCREWGRTIANLHILRFEENRSAQAELASVKISHDHLRLARMDNPHDLRGNFSLTREDLYSSNHGKVLKFVEGARDRLICIYTDWFESLGISILLGDPKE